MGCNQSSDLYEADKDPAKRREQGDSATPGAAESTRNAEPVSKTSEPAGSAEAKISDQLVTKRLALERRRRVNVTAESYVVGEYERRVVPKSDEEKAAIKASLASHFLFANLPPNEMDELIDAMEAEETKEGQVVINQGDDGDKFYVVEHGDFSVLVNGTNVATLGQGKNFGELALMYGCPRAASIVGAGDGKLWALDRATFRHILIESNSRTIADNARFLRRVQLLENLDDTQIVKLAEALQRVQFEDGTYIIRQGDDGNIFYLLQEGTANVTQTKADGPNAGREMLLMGLSAGDFFGERALLNSEPRAANIVATSACVCMALDRDSFTELLGPLADLMGATHEQRQKIAEANEGTAADGTTVEEGTAAATAAESKAGGGGDGEVSALREDVALSDLEMVAILGEGAFGLVKLVKKKGSGETFALKCMQKARIVATSQQKNVVTEKQLMREVQHPFVLRLEASYRDRDQVYMLLEFLQGGDIFGHLIRVGGVFSEATTKFYAATVALVFGHLHERHILYRDLKPENLVLDGEGFCKVVDFGFAKRVVTRTYTLCGTPEYLAPEIVKGKGHNKGVDYWALGILIYEFLCGYSPFADPAANNQLTIYKNIMRGKVLFPASLRSGRAKDLIKHLLVGNPTKRLGCLQTGIEGVKQHPWFNDLDFDQLLARGMTPPIVPQIRNALDVSNFDTIQPSFDVVEPFVSDGSDWDLHF